MWNYDNELIEIMRSLIVTICLWFMTCGFIQAQDKMPQTISYQAVARDAQGKVVSEKSIGVKVEILKGSATGNVVFSETHTPTSSKTGTVNLLIGQGTVGSGTFASIDWGTDTYFLQLSMDLSGGSDYKIVSTTQMLPVPYALYAAKAGAIENGGSGNISTNIRNYAITGMDQFSTIDMLSKGIVEVDKSWSDNKADFDFMILYLTGIDLQMDAAIEGAEIQRNEYERTFQSDKIGHAFQFHVNLSAEDIGKTIKLLIKDKDGNVVEEFPLVVAEYKRDY